MFTVAAHPSVTMPDAAPTVGRLRRLSGPVAVVLGSCAGAAGLALHIRGGQPDEAQMREIAAGASQWLTSHLLMGFGWALLAVGILSAFRLVRGRGAALTGTGIAVLFVGAGLMSLGDIGHGTLAYALTDHVDAATSLAIQEDYFGNPVILVLSMGGMLMPLGIMLLAGGLLRARSVPRWAAVVLLFSPLGIQLGYSTELPFAPLTIPLVLGMTVLARAIGSEPWQGSTPHRTASAPS